MEFMWSLCVQVEFKWARCGVNEVQLWSGLLEWMWTGCGLDVGGCGVSGVQVESKWGVGECKIQTSPLDPIPFLSCMTSSSLHPQFGPGASCDPVPAAFDGLDLDLLEVYVSSFGPLEVCIVLYLTCRMRGGCCVDDSSPSATARDKDQISRVPNSQIWKQALPS